MDNEELKQLPKMYRTMDISADLSRMTREDASGEQQQLYELSASSDAEINRWFGYEILDHSAAAVDMSRMNSGAAVLVDHGSDQVGVVERAVLDENAGKMRVAIRFSKNPRGQEIERDVADGIRRNVSIGYVVQQVKQLEKRDGVPVYKVTRWQPLEVSIVAVPADISVGVNRSVEAGETTYPVELEDGNSAVREEHHMMQDSIKYSGGGAGGSSDHGDPVPQPVETRDNRKDYAEIVQMCEANGMTARASEFIMKGMNADQVAREILVARRSFAGAQPNAESLEDLGLKKKDARKYSYARAILGAALLSEGKRFDGLEMEVHDELQARHPEGASRRGGLLVPMQRTNVDTRALDSNTVNKGSEVVFEKQGELIELLRNRAAVMMLGARSLTGLNAPVAFPKQSSAMSAYWVGENPGANVTSSDLGLSLAVLTPKTLQATTAYSRQLLAQSAIDVESLVTNELSIVHALAIDLAAIHGKGVAGEPAGIYKATGVNAFDATSGGTTMTYAKLLSMVGQVATANADSGSLGWLMNPTMATNLKGIAMFSNTATPVWAGDYVNGNVAGYRATASNQVSKVMSGSESTGGSAIGCVFGDWSQMLVGFWGALELVVDPYAQKKQGLIEVTSFQLADVLVRHGESFSKATGATG